MMQLFSIDQQKSQPLEAHAAAFASVKVKAQCTACIDLHAACLLHSGTQ